MGELLTFPGLGLEFRLTREAFHIGGYPIAWYGIIMATAFLVGICYVMWRTKEFGLDGDRVIDVLLLAVVGGIIGARAYYVIFSWDEYKDNIANIFKIWEGGIAIYGGLIGAVLVGLLVCKMRKVKMLPMLDLATGGLIMGQAIGRWGNFVNIEAFGANTTLPWGMGGPAVERYLAAHQAQLAEIGVTVDPTMLVHPTFFYESVWCLLGFVAIALFTKRRRFDGELVLLYATWYGAGRSVIEGLRTDSLMLGNIRISQALSIVGVLVAVVLWVMIRNKIKQANDPDFMRLYVHSEEAELIRKGEFYKKTKEETTVDTQLPTSEPVAEPEEQPQTETIEPQAETEEKVGDDNGSNS